MGNLGAVQFELPPLDFHIKMMASVLCGGLIGFERYAKGKQTGIKTNIMICVGSMVFASIAAQLLNESGGGDASRVLGQIVSGIGFLGAGAIFARDGAVIGLTSASVVWVNAGVGSAIGYGFVAEAIIVTINSVLLMLIVGRWERAHRRELQNQDIHHH